MSAPENLARSRILVKAEGLSAGYGSGRRDIVRDIGFTLREGERLCVIGANGCGKTTLLRVLAGILPYRGSLAFAARDVDGTLASPDADSLVERSLLGPKEAARTTAFLAQISSSYFPFTVGETVMMGRYARRQGGLSGPSPGDRAAVRAAMDACGLSDLADRPIARLSGGQLQRAFLARALAQEPSILLLDEPTNHLDLFYQIDLLGRIRERMDSGLVKASIGVFHDLLLARRFATSMILLDGGEIVAYGSPDEVLESPEANRVYRMNVGQTLRDLLQNG